MLISIRFDPAGAMSPHFRVTPGQLESLAAPMIQLREDVIADLSPRMSFLGLPYEQLKAYERIRQASDLGRIFKVANGLHDRIDAVVILGPLSGVLAAKGFFHACCDPYHNELSRAERGSKPRMYFAGFDFDNDETAALLSRLAMNGEGESSAEKRWAIVVVDADGNSIETQVALQHFILCLERKLGNDAAELIKELVVLQLGPTSKLRQFAGDRGIAEVFDISNQLDECHDVLSPVGLLPVAMLGLDCMKLLAGAVDVTEHFTTTRYKENLILRFVAIRHLQASELGIEHRMMRVWNSPLQAFATWYDQLAMSLCGNRATRMGHRTTATTTNAPKLVCDVIVSTFRQDALVVDPHTPPELSSPSRKRDAKSPLTFSDMMSTSIRQNREATIAAGEPAVEIAIPRIDTHELGQLIQFWLITTELERRMNGSALN